MVPRPSSAGGLVETITADEESAREIMLRDPAVTSGLMTPELRQMRVGFLRGRD